VSEKTPSRPAPEGYASWPAYWQAQGMPWRTGPEIDQERQAYLDRQRAIAPDIEQGIYPFRDEHGSITLTRGDVEWLLATHEDGRGPVVWAEEWNKLYDDRRWGLDLRGADLRAVNLRGLPLSRLRAGMRLHERLRATPSEWEMAGAHLEEADLYQAHLEEAACRCVHLEASRLRAARLQGAFLARAHLKAANLWEAHLDGAYLGEAHLEGAYLKEAFFDSATVLSAVTLGNQQNGYASMADVRWDGVNLAVVIWEPFTMLGDESEARRPTDAQGNLKDEATRLGEYETAIRAYRQLAVALRDQGLSEYADRFAYRGQVLQRQLLWRRRQLGRWAFSVFLAAIAGYGYRLWRILAAYGLTLAAFALAYYLAGRVSAPHLSPYEAAIVSFTALHGRVFLGQFGLDSPLSLIAGIEAVVGIVIEGVFVAMLVQRFFAR
jgi:hypothetical protein